MEDVDPFAGVQSELVGGDEKTPAYKAACPQTCLIVSKSAVADLAGVNLVAFLTSSQHESSQCVMSYNLMGWSSFNANSWKGENVLGKINSWEPDLLGAQEVEKGGWGYQEVEELLMSSTGLSFAGGSQFFRPSKLEKLDQDWIALVGGYWMSMALYKHLDTGREILFYDSHWKHGYGLQQAETIANKIAADRTKYGSPPTILVGDTNQFCEGPKTEALRYLKGELQGSQGFSPVDLVDVHGEDQGRSFSDDNNPDCRVDFILASQGQWSVVQVAVDRGGMGSWGSASDHAPLIANLIPLFA
ncbi:unnamed protein product [Symbiodinium sp. CCMP2592]|nr:unnamed protein product [Symbiodinium sp. CCMP2592]